MSDLEAVHESLEDVKNGKPLDEAKVIDACLTPKSVPVRRGKRDSAELDDVGSPLLKRPSLDGDEVRTLKLELEKKKETLRRLKMVKTYREKKEMQNLDEVTRKWKESCQEALEELYQVASDSGRCSSMKELILNLGISTDTVGWDEEADTFT